MGWKAFKDHFKIEHIVCMRNGKLLIGSEYVVDLVTINIATGEIREHDTFDNFLQKQYPQLLEASAADLKQIIEMEDTFSNSIPIFTYEKANLVEKQCEFIGWPNVTHDGYLMYSNTFSTDKNVILKKIKRNLLLDKEFNEKHQLELDEKLTLLKEKMAQNQADIERFDTEYPELNSENSQ